MVGSAETMQRQKDDDTVIDQYRQRDLDEITCRTL